MQSDQTNVPTYEEADSTEDTLVEFVNPANIAMAERAIAAQARHRTIKERVSQLVRGLLMEFPEDVEDIAQILEHAGTNILSTIEHAKREQRRRERSTKIASEKEE